MIFDQKDDTRMSKTLHTFTYPFRVGKEIDNQLTIIKTLRGEVLNASEAFIGKTVEDLQMYLIKNLVELKSPKRYVYQLLLLGCSWRTYYETASTPGTSLKERFGRFLNKDEKARARPPGYTLKNLEEVLGWMESRDELRDENGDLQMMKRFLQSDPEAATEHIRNMVVFADWFKTSSRMITGEKDSERLLYYVRLMGFET